MIHLALCLRALEHWVELAGYAEDEHTGKSLEMTWEISYPQYVGEAPASIEMQRQIRDWADKTRATNCIIDFKPSLLPNIARTIAWFPVHQYFPSYDRKVEPSAMAAARKIVKSRISKS